VNFRRLRVDFWRIAPIALTLVLDNPIFAAPRSPSSRDCILWGAATTLVTGNK